MTIDIKNVSKNMEILKEFKINDTVLIEFPSEGMEDIIGTIVGFAFNDVYEIVLRVKIIKHYQETKETRFFNPLKRTFKITKIS